MRVVVTFEDGRSELIMLKDDLGVKRDDWPMIRKKLFLQGVRDVVCEAWREGGRRRHRPAGRDGPAEQPLRR